MRISWVLSMLAELEVSERGPEGNGDVSWEQVGQAFFCSGLGNSAELGCLWAADSFTR